MAHSGSAGMRRLAGALALAAILIGDAAAAKDPAPAGSVPTVIVPAPESERDRRDDYSLDLMTLALEKSRPADGDYRIVRFGLVASNARKEELLRTGEIDVMWISTSTEREHEFRPVRIPLMKGLLGYRLLIIRKQDAEKFAKVQTIGDLKTLVAGQGGNWPDTTILRAAGLRVETSESYEPLFAMLYAGRYDFFPRGAMEPFAELEARRHLYPDLIVEPTLALYYPLARYFFVRQPNVALAERLERGLRAAIADGSFETLFKTHPQNQVMWEKAGIGQRRVIRINNPLLPPETPLGDKALWHSATQTQ